MTTIIPPVRRFLDLIAFSEGTSNHSLTVNNGYDVIVTGVDGKEIFSDYADHPFANRPPKVIRLNPPLQSTAAGRYQLLYRYWKIYRVELALPDYSPTSQDQVAIKQIQERRAYSLILEGKIQAAIGVCSNIWASFPGNSYGQNAHSIETLLNKFETL